MFSYEKVVFSIQMQKVESTSKDSNGFSIPFNLQPALFTPTLNFKLLAVSSYDFWLQQN